MTMHTLVGALFALASCVCAGQAPGFEILRYEEDYSKPLNESLPVFYRMLKHTGLGDGAGYFSAGGELRLLGIASRNAKWGDEPRHAKSYALSRALIHGSLKWKPARVFVQLQASNAYGLAGAAPPDKNVAELHQVFLDYTHKKDVSSEWLARLGRQEMLLGSQRLVGVREGPNTRLSFDGLRFIASWKRFRTDNFYVHPVKNKPGAFNDHFGKDARLWGSYWTLTTGRSQHLDLYYLHFIRLEAMVDDAYGTERRHSFGFRVWDNSDNFHYDVESVFQSGTFGGKSICAYTVSADVSYKADHLWLRPRFGLRSEIISGDRTHGDTTVGTFNPIYPRGGYFGLAALIGPSNLADVHPSIALQLSNTLGFEADYDIFWRMSRGDGIYAPNLSLLYHGSASARRFTGSQLSSGLTYQPSALMLLSIEGSWFRPGSFLKEASAGKDYFYSAVTARFRF